MKNRIRKLLIPVLLLALLPGILGVPAYASGKEDIDRMIDSIPPDWPQEPDIHAGAAILMDAESGEILYAKNATEEAYPASTTKLMTALLALENNSLKDIVDFPFEATNIPAGSSHIGMRRGEQMVLQECLYGLLLPSANEVANALAIKTSGSIDRFVGTMNERAKELGCVNTNFKNANGLQAEGHYTCPYDLALIMQACVKNTTFVEIASTASYVHHADELLNKDIPMTNTDKMIRPSSEYYNENVVCGKTGHTDEAGYNLVTYAEKDGTHLIVVVMNAEDGAQYIATQSLLDYGFNYFETMLPAELDTSLNMEHAYTDSPLGIPVPEVNLLSLNAAESILIPVNVTFDMLDKSVSRDGDKISVNYSYEGYPLGHVTLHDADTEKKNSIFRPKVQETLNSDFGTELLILDGWLIVAILVGILICVIIILVLIHETRPGAFRRRKKKKYKRL